jgi:hypothetical protein
MPSLRFSLEISLLAVCAALCSAQTTVQVTVGASPSGPAFFVDGVAYSTAQTMTWTVGSSHSLLASSPQTFSTGDEYTFSSWSDGGASSHTVTASASTTAYTANFSTSYELSITVSGNGTVTPASGNYYAAGSVVGIKGTPSQNYNFNKWTGSTDIADTKSASTTITMNSPENIEGVFEKPHVIQYLAPVYVVTTATDDATGVPGNCPFGGPFGTTGLNCSLRDALAGAEQAQGANISFSSTVFALTNTAAQNTITLTGGTLFVPENTVLTGPVSVEGHSAVNLVTVDGGNKSTAFWVNSGATQVYISALKIAGGLNSYGGGGVYNDGSLTLSQVTVSGSSAVGGEGGGIYNDKNGTLAISDSTISGNTAGNGGGIVDYGVLSLTDCTVSGNTADKLGGGIYEYGNGTVTSSTVAVNQAGATGGGGGIAVALDSGLSLANSIVSGNKAPDLNAEVSGAYENAGGNVVQDHVRLAPLGFYGGATETQIPLPESRAICAGDVKEISPIVMSDQRGEPDMNTTYPGYSASMPCVDAGAVQTNYALAFTTQPEPISPASSILLNTRFAASVTLTESGSPFAGAVTVPLTLAGPGLLAGGSARTVKGVATYPALHVNATGSTDALAANLTLNPDILPKPPAVTAASNPFAVKSLATTTVADHSDATFTAGAQGVRLKATVTSATEPVNTGTVTFILLYGNGVLGLPVTSSPVTGGEASVKYIVPARALPRSYPILAVYNPSGPFAESSDSSHSLILSRATTVTSLTSSSGSVDQGANVTFTGLVTGTTAATPTGSVEFWNGATRLGKAALNANGEATYSTASLAVGTHELTAVYLGDLDFAGSTSPDYAQTVVAPDFSLTTNPTAITLGPGKTGNVIVTLAPVGGFTGTVNLACVGPAANFKCGFAEVSLKVNGSGIRRSTNLIMTNGDKLMPGSYPIFVTATPAAGASKGVGAQTVALTLTVAPTP